ncbi:Cytochrome P450 CYP72A219 [Vitis vinifera]|uniref:Cytochrome P450 CYP72A219 n=1 Tax=Vitis vinifera TaxID=29760 RepID=A0A438H1H7_VITVI|nr:Cytochrome P450 CYP72A219 [Vitis vinifera]
MKYQKVQIRWSSRAGSTLRHLPRCEGCELSLEALKKSLKLEMKHSSVAISFGFLTVLISCLWRLLNWVWLRPKRLERCLREQGLAGNSYRLLHGDFKEMSMMLKEAYSRPISLSDDIAPRVLPFHCHFIKKYGTDMSDYFSS